MILPYYMYMYVIQDIIFLTPTCIDYRLKAADAKDRQNWVSLLHQEVEHANTLAIGPRETLQVRTLYIYYMYSHSHTLSLSLSLLPFSRPLSRHLVNPQLPFLHRPTITMATAITVAPPIPNPQWTAVPSRPPNTALHQRNTAASPSYRPLSPSL